MLKKLTLFTLFIGIITLHGFILRIYQFAEKPNGLYVDEVAIGFNAYTILKTGKDEYGNRFPVLFRSFNDYKLPVYIYLTSISEFFLGKNPAAVRLPSVLFGTLSIPVFIYLINLLTHKRKLALVGGFLLAVSPWHLQFSRTAFEANVNLFIILLATLITIYSLRGRCFLFLIGLSLFSLGIYTYQSSLIIAPLLLVVIFLVFKEKREEMFHLPKNKKFIIFSFGLLCFMLLPYFLHFMQALNRGISESFLRDVHPYKSDAPSTVLLLSIDQFVRNFLSYFSLDYLFFEGDSIGRHSVREMGMIYVWELPFYIAGISLLFKKMNKSKLFFFLFLLLSPIAASLATPNPHALRGLSPLIPIIFFISSGIDYFCNRLSDKWTSIFKIALTCMVIYNMILYLHIYYIHYPKRSSPDWSSGYRETVKFLLDAQKSYSTIYITNSFPRSYIYLLFYGDFDLREVENHLNYKSGFGKFKYVDSPFIYHPEGKALYVGPQWENWHGTLLNTIKNAGGDTVLKIWEN